MEPGGGFSAEDEPVAKITAVFQRGATAAPALANFSKPTRNGTFGDLIRH